MVKGLNTFGPFDWKVYYSLAPQRRVAEAEAAAWVQKRAALAERFTRVPQDLPCLTCPCAATPGGCGRGIDPDGVTCCRKFAKWYRVAWLAITEGIKRAAPELEPPKAAKETIHLHCTGSTEKVKEKYGVKSYFTYGSPDPRS